MLAVALSTLAGRAVCAQAAQRGDRPLPLADLIAIARAASPELRAARDAVQAAAALARQAAAIANPVLAYGREQTSRGNQTNAQNIVQLEQALEVSGQRSARRDAALLRRDAAELRLLMARNRVDADVARGVAVAIAAFQRTRLVERFSAVFAEAQRVTDQRLSAGDVSGYTARRMRLEAARYAAMRATVALEQRTARVALASLLGRSAMASDSLALPEDLSAEGAVLDRVTPSPDLPLDSLLRIGSAHRPELLLARLEAATGLADARVASRARLPVPVLTAGRKDERVADGVGSLGGFSGYIVGLSVALPIFDRRSGAIAAAAADARASASGVEIVARRVMREVADAVDALRSAEQQRRALAPFMGVEAELAMTAVQTAYVEGEISLVEWLDAVRAYQDAQTAYLTLVADVTRHRIALAQALGVALVTEPRASGSDAGAAPSGKN